MKKSYKNLDLLEDENLGQKLVKKGFWLYLFSYLIAPAGYLVRLLISNSPEVSVADVGILYSIISLINFLNVYNDLGLTESLQYFLPKFWIKKQYNQIKTTIFLSLGVQFFTAIWISLCLWFGADWLSAEYFQSPISAKILKYFCLYFLGINLFQTLQSIFIAFQKTFDYQFVEFIKIWTTVWFTFFCFFTGRWTIEWYSLNWLLGLGVGILIAGFLYWFKYRTLLMQGCFEWDKPMLKEYRNYALWAFLGANIGNVFGQIIQQMVVYFLGAEAAGYYANFLSLFYIGNMIIWPIMGLILPIVSQLSEQKNYENLNQLTSFFYNYFSIVGFSISALLVSFWPELAIIAFWEKFYISGELLIYAWFFLIFNILSMFNFSCLWGLWKIKERVMILWATTFFTAIFTFFSVRSWIIHYSALAFWFSSFYLRLFTWFVLKKTISIQLDRKFIIKNIIIIFIFSLWILYYKNRLIHYINRKYSTLFIIFIVSILFYILLVLFNQGYLKKVYHIYISIKKSI